MDGRSRQSADAQRGGGRAAEAARAVPPARLNSRRSALMADYGATPAATRLTQAQALDAAGLGLFQIFFTGTCGILVMADAMEMVIISVVSPALKCEFSIDELHMAMLASVVFAGFCVGNYFWGLAADRWGRRPCVSACTLITGGFGLACAVAPSFEWLLVLRGLVGFGVGGLPAAAVLNSELVPSAMRERVAGFFWLFFGIGSCAETGMAYFVMPSLGWRWQVAFTAVPMLVAFLISFLLSESPGWLMCNGRPEDAKAVIKRVAKMNGTLEKLGDFVLVPEIEPKRSGGEERTAPMCAGTVSLFVVLSVMWFTIMAQYYGTALIQSEMIQAIDSGERCLEYSNSSGFEKANRAIGAGGIPVETGLLQSASTAKQTAMEMHHGSLDRANTMSSNHQVRLEDSFYSFYSGEVARRHQYTDAPSAIVQPHTSKAAFDPVCNLSGAEYVEMLATSAGDLIGWLIQQMIVSSGLLKQHQLVVTCGIWAAGSYLVLTLGCPGRTIEALLLLSVRSATVINSVLVWTFTGDIFPDAVRGSAMGILSGTGRLGCITTGFVAESLSHTSWPAAFGTYSIFGLMATAAVLSLPPAILHGPVPSSMSVLQRRAATGFCSIVRTSGKLDDAMT